MIEIKIGDIIIRTETLKEAQRLARKEEKKQAKIEKAADRDRGIAYNLAYAEMGKLADSQNPRLWFVDPVSAIRREESTQYIRCDGEYGTGEIALSENYRVSILVCHANGALRFMRTEYGHHRTKPDRIEVNWSACGVWERACAIITMPATLMQMLEERFQAERPAGIYLPEEENN